RHRGPGAPAARQAARAAHLCRPSCTRPAPSRWPPLRLVRHPLLRPLRRARPTPAGLNSMSLTRAAISRCQTVAVKSRINNEADGVLAIGALTRESELEESEIVRARYPLLYDTCKVIADPLVRNLATIGGNLAHADPANDHPATMLALGAELVARGRGGERRIPITSFFTGPFETALRPGELLVEIRIPAPAPRSGGAYLKLERKVGDFATAAVAAQLTLRSDGAVEQAGIALTNVGLTPIK